MFLKFQSLQEYIFKHLFKALRLHKSYKRLNKKRLVENNSSQKVESRKREILCIRSDLAIRFLNSNFNTICIFYSSLQPQPTTCLWGKWMEIEYYHHLFPLQSRLYSFLQHQHFKIFLQHFEELNRRVKMKRKQTKTLFTVLSLYSYENVVGCINFTFCEYSIAIDKIQHKDCLIIYIITQQCLWQH